MASGINGDLAAGIDGDLVSGIDGDMASVKYDGEVELPKGFLKKLFGKLSCKSKLSDLQDAAGDVNIDVNVNTDDLKESFGNSDGAVDVEINKDLSGYKCFGFKNKIPNKKGLPRFKVPAVNVNVELQKPDMCALQSMSGDFDGLLDVNVHMKTPTERSDLNLTRSQSSLRKKVFE